MTWWQARWVSQAGHTVFALRWLLGRGLTLVWLNSTYADPVA